MGLIETALLAMTCLLVHDPAASCVTRIVTQLPAAVAGERVVAPSFTGEAVDVVLTAEAALAWDLESGELLYQKNVDARRPVASLSKLLAALTVTELLADDEAVEISVPAVRVQRRGASIGLPLGHHVPTSQLLEAGLIASANDALVALATAAAGSEEEFVEYANAYAKRQGLFNTKLANATGLSGGEQHSTARDVKRMLTKAYAEPRLSHYLAQPTGTLLTQEGVRLSYTSTNKLLTTYVPIVAAKTGYTREAGENLAIITEGAAGQRIGAVILGSEARFQDMKVLTEWVWRNFSWPPDQL